jgi:hypothetical protein
VPSYAKATDAEGIDGCCIGHFCQLFVQMMTDVGITEISIASVVARALRRGGQDSPYLMGVFNRLRMCMRGKDTELTRFQTHSVHTKHRTSLCPFDSARLEHDGPIGSHNIREPPALSSLIPSASLEGHSANATSSPGGDPTPARFATRRRDHESLPNAADHLTHLIPQSFFPMWAAQ